MDYARERKTQKRDGGRGRVDLSDALMISDDRLDEIIVIDAALNRLAEWDPRQCRVVELRFFSGLTEDEIAGDSPHCQARLERREAWLHGELNGPAGNV